MSFAMVSANSSNALASAKAFSSNDNGPLTCPDKINAVVNEATGEVEIESYVVTNTENDFFKFNTVKTTKTAEYENVT